VAGRRRMPDSGESALVVLSGGQDSTTCLYWAIDRFGRNAVSSLTFDYGQRHRVELECARKVASAAGVSNTCLPINTFSALGGDALTDRDIDVKNDIDVTSGLPNTFVPGRNLIFLTFAAAFAYQGNIGNLVTGVAQTDYSGYPDCRAATIESLQESIRLGMDSDIRIHTPLMHLSKQETVELAVKLGALDAMLLTHTCYEGQRPPCGKCPACLLRAKGFADAGVIDPLVGANDLRG
jgi:7-cyano-7-deazaguanine synthase